jgi:hypothetical protein
MGERVEQRGRRAGLIAYVAVAVAVVLTPFLVTSALLWTRHNATLADLTPFWSDELTYWGQARAFRAVDFETGYFTYGEVPPALAFSRFYTWGAFVPMFYGALGKLVAWELNTLPLLNMALVTGALAMLVIMTRPRLPTLVWLAVALGTSLPLLWLLPASLQEGLHFAIALVTAAGFARLLNGQSLPRPLYALFFFCASLLRPSWAAFLLPLVWLRRDDASLRRKLFESALVLMAAGVAFWLFNGSGAPHPTARAALFAAASTPFDVIAVQWGIFWGNVRDFFTDTDAMGLIQRVQLLVFGLWLAGQVWARWRGKVSAVAYDEAIFHAYHVGAMIGALLLLYVVGGGRDFRLLAGHWLVALVVFVLCRRPQVAFISLLTVALTAPVWLQVYDGWTAPRTGYITQDWQAWREPLQQAAPYTPHADAWCNTVTVSQPYVVETSGAHYLVLALDEGLGTSWFYSGWSPSDFKARYYMLTDSDYAYLSQRVALQERLRLPLGALYEREGACLP